MFCCVFQGHRQDVAGVVLASLSLLSAPGGGGLLGDVRTVSFDLSTAAAVQLRPVAVLCWTWWSQHK